MPIPCPTCQNKGIVTLNFQEGDEYGLCLCRVGEDMRKNRLWELWCAREGVGPGKVSKIEDILTPEELASKGFQELQGSEAMSAVIRAARTRQRRS